MKDELIELHVVKSNYSAPRAEPITFRRCEGGALEEVSAQDDRSWRIALALGTFLFEKKVELGKRDLIDKAMDGLCVDAQEYIDAAVKSKVSKKDREAAIEHGIREGLLTVRDDPSSTRNPRKLIGPGQGISAIIAAESGNSPKPSQIEAEEK